MPTASFYEAGIGGGDGEKSPGDGFVSEIQDAVAAGFVPGAALGYRRWGGEAGEGVEEGFGEAGEGVGRCWTLDGGCGGHVGGVHVGWKGLDGGLNGDVRI